MIGNFHEVLNFDQLFLKLNQFMWLATATPHSLDLDKK